MELKRMPYDLSVCKVRKIEDVDMDAEFYFFSKTDEELSLVCRTADTPAETTAPELVLTEPTPTPEPEPGPDPTPGPTPQPENS